MLTEKNIISREEAFQIIEGIKKLDVAEGNLPHNVGYMSTETNLIKQIGEVGGKMHIGRSRNDLGHTQAPRAVYQERLINLMKKYPSRT